jgi:V/A-type H+-transporting ATPase subunit C
MTLSTRRAARYAEVSAAVRAMKSKMVGREGYDRLLRCSSSSECMSILQERGYFEAATVSGELLDPALWHGLFDTRMVALLHKLVNLSPEDCAELLAEFEGQYRLELLKSALRLIVAHEEKETPSDTMPSELSPDFLRGTVETRNVEHVVQAAGAPMLYSEISSALAEKKPLALVEAIVDKYALTRIWVATDMSDWIDRQSVQALVGEHIDVTNLLLVARSKALGIAGDELQRCLVPVNYRLGDALAEAARSGSTTNALRVFTKTTYASSVERFVDTFKERGSLHSLAVSLRRRHAARCLSAFSGFPFCAGLPLAFAYLRGYEAADLHCIISGKQDGLATEKIEPLLIL